MSIEGKHAYRFVFLRSEKWKDLRIEALARDDAKCQICLERNLSNDAHHIYYPPSVYDTQADDLVILCRPCHELVEAIIRTDKTKDISIKRFRFLVNAIAQWKLNKQHWLDDPKIHSPRKRELTERTHCVGCSKVVPGIELYFLFSKYPTQRQDTFWPLCPVCKYDMDNNFPWPESPNGVWRLIRQWIEFRRKTS